MQHKNNEFETNKRWYKQRHRQKSIKTESIWYNTQRYQVQQKTLTSTLNLILTWEVTNELSLMQ